MKHTKLAVSSAAAIVALFVLLMVAGCGGGAGSGKITNDITSPYYGAMGGVLTVPADNDMDVPKDAWIRVYWPDPLTPPREFTVRLEKEETPGNWGGVHTTLRGDFSYPADADWWFEPTSNFSPFTWYRIVIQAPGETTVMSYFYTNDEWDDLSMSNSTRSLSTNQTSKSYRPAGATKGAGEGSTSHTITVSK
jgi:hypothetical protein